MNPLVTTIIPVYNGEKFLSQAIESVRGQNYAPLEIIVVDDGSTDGTADRIKNLGDDIHYIYQENRGPAAARNTGLKLARGEFIAFLDVDDLWPEGKLGSQVERLLQDPSLEIVTGRIQYIFLDGTDDSLVRNLDGNNTVSSVNLGSALFRRSVFEKVGVFNETLQRGEDGDWFLRALEQDVSILILDEVTLYYRQHGKNITRGLGNRERGLFQILKKSLDRRRLAGGGEVRPLKDWSDYSEGEST
jgi:glycosyltransferase involved in cell wall biosynthesis